VVPWSIASKNFDACPAAAIHPPVDWRAMMRSGAGCVKRLDFRTR
jgi:hypothetical protein